MGSWTSAPRPGAADAGPGRGEGSSTFPPSAEAVGGTQVAEEKVEANFIVLGPGFCDYLHGLPVRSCLALPGCVSLSRGTQSRSCTDHSSSPKSLCHPQQSRATGRVGGPSAGFPFPALASLGSLWLLAPSLPPSPLPQPPPASSAVHRRAAQPLRDLLAVGVVGERQGMSKGRLCWFSGYPRASAGKAVEKTGAEGEQSPRGSPGCGERSGRPQRPLFMAAVGLQVRGTGEL